MGLKIWSDDTRQSVVVAGDGNRISGIVQIAGDNSTQIGSLNTSRRRGGVRRKRLFSLGDFMDAFLPKAHGVRCDPVSYLVGEGKISEGDFNEFLSIRLHSRDTWEPMFSWKEPARKFGIPEPEALPTLGDFLWALGNRGTCTNLEIIQWVREWEKELGFGKGR